MDSRKDGKPIKGWERYRVLEDGTVRNRDGYAVKPDKGGCVSIHYLDKRKSFSLARLIAIYYLSMPDDKKHCAFKIDPNGGFEVSNISWDTLANHNKDRLAQARAIKANHERINKQCEEEEIYEELINV